MGCLERLEGLGDEEFRWERVPGAWTVRRMRDGRQKLDHSSVPVSVAPITSIAWRVSHLIDVYGSNRNWVGLRSKPVEALSEGASWQIGWTAEESIAMLKDSIDRFLDLLGSMTDELLWERLGPVAVPFADGTLVSFVHHQIDEAIHHGAEVGILRSLWAAQSYKPPSPATIAEAADLGRWDLVESMVRSW